ncbi:hypothetical protein [Streptomyces sp. TS71-3]|uniref:hypothetical protein n=1 Tax=Streptomyces sp. TS71-3 TaxID=2733862 RepID=UPI001B07345D|nr:hypothetical protein [Streptomyces sp. TS71-3]GHJ41703.1 hypothetical protein Sm713_73120 [Streptomyces sp. TS71-3]
MSDVRPGRLTGAFAECHARPGTEALLGGLDVAPRARCAYGGRWFEEVDLAAVLERRRQPCRKDAVKAVATAV